MSKPTELQSCRWYVTYVWGILNPPQNPICIAEAGSYHGETWSQLREELVAGSLGVCCVLGDIERMQLPEAHTSHCRRRSRLPPRCLREYVLTTKIAQH